MRSRHNENKVFKFSVTTSKELFLVFISFLFKPNQRILSVAGNKLFEFTDHQGDAPRLV